MFTLYKNAKAFVLQFVLGSHTVWLDYKTQISFTNSSCGSIMTLSGALRMSCVLTTHGLLFALPLGMTIIAVSRVIRHYWQ